MKVAETKNSIIVGTVGNLAVADLTHSNILYIVSFYGVNTDPDKFGYHMIPPEGAKKRGCKFPINNFSEFLEIFKN